MHTVRRVIAGLGRTFISTGVLVLLFVIYELYGTSLQEAQAQKDLQSKIKNEAKSALTTASTIAPANYVPPAPPPAGEALATLKIDKLGLYKAVVEGVDTNDLKKGPGHYAGTPLPGEAGNVAIAGHRTTYGAPFRKVDQLVPGSRIVLAMPYGTFTYKVTGTRITTPSDASALRSHTGVRRLVLTACHPLYSAAQRIVVTARLASAIPA
jgi:sortase A